MLRSVTGILGYELGAKEGDPGAVETPITHESELPARDYQGRPSHIRAEGGSDKSVNESRLP